MNELKKSALRNEGVQCLTAFLSSTNEDIGDRIRRIREQRNMSRQALADTLGISVNFLGKIESGKRELRIGKIANIIVALQICCDELSVLPKET